MPTKHTKFCSPFAQVQRYNLGMLHFCFAYMPQQNKKKKFRLDCIKEKKKTLINIPVQSSQLRRIISYI